MKNDVIQLLARQLYSRATEANASSVDSEYPYSRLQHIGYFILFFFPTLAFIIFGLRIYGRFVAKQYGWDDLFISLAMVLSVAETICSYYSMHENYIGIRRNEIPIKSLVNGRRWAFTIQILYNPILAFVKTSVLIFLLRLGREKDNVRLAIIGLLTFNLVQTVATFLCILLQCTPISFFWESGALNPEDIPDGYCIDQSKLYIATAALTILTDVLVLVLPFWIFLGLNMPLRVRAAVIGVFALGGVVTIMSILRLAWLVEINYYIDYADPDVDFTYDIRFTYSAIETNIAIITASAPALRPLFVRWFPSFFSALRSSGTRYSHANDAYGRLTAATAKHSHGGTRVSLHGAFPLKDMKGQRRSEIRSHSPTNSEEEIMTHNGILKTSEVKVQYNERRPQPHQGDESESESSRMSYTSRGPNGV
ncbi:hypothetical protein FZEAL_8828 [Fusarium zealandicum]|uniref:Rhodopsin domain-containing protein n=1 Tax=Fusarium zealandicum TaxID=1053134 RepID=A0A8H4UDI9_9HYPO|nr:hypothetical protein FZEAL_8828 [Fusarium zealandicum]